MDMDETFGCVSVSNRMPISALLLFVFRRRSPHHHLIEDEIGTTNAQMEEDDPLDVTMMTPAERCRYHVIMLSETVGKICKYCKTVCEEIHDILSDFGTNMGNFFYIICRNSRVIALHDFPCINMDMVVVKFYASCSKYCIKHDGVLATLADDHLHCAMDSSS